jgi:hypothetical protein
MNDVSILLLYVVVFTLNRSVSSLLALLVFALVAYTAYNADFNYTYDDTYFYAVLSAVYAICAIQMRKWKESAWAGCVFVSLYYLYFSFDSWINWDVETWAYQNHESIVFTAHILVMLLLVEVRIALVCSRARLLWRNHCSRKTN